MPAGEGIVEGAASFAGEGVKYPRKLPRQVRRSHQEPVDRPRAQATLADRPDHQRLAAAHVARRKHVRARGLIVGGVGADVAARVEIDAERLQQTLVYRMHETHREQYELRVEVELGAGHRLEAIL